MEKEKDKFEMEGIIEECLSNSMFRVNVNGKPVLGYLSGKMKLHFIQITPGDKVKIEISKYDFTKGRITFRMKA